MRQALIVLGVGLLLAGCQTTSVNKPCGVITDNLGNVRATTRDGDRRLAAHYEVGVAAGCWKRGAP